MSFSSENTRPVDPIAHAFRTYAQNILIVVFGLLPLFFVPSALAPFEYTKIFFVLIGVLVALMLYSLSVLRSGTFTVGFSFSVCAIWLVAGVAFLSSLFSGDFQDSLIGDLMSVHSTAFVAILALVMSVWVLLNASKNEVMRLYMLLSASTLVLVAFQVVRLFFGPTVASMGVFTSTISTPMGSWNDLALFLGLSVILSLVALEQLPLTKPGRLLFGGVAVVALFMLGVINFFTVWLVLGLTSLALIVYSLSKDRFSASQPALVTSKSTNLPSLVVSLIVFAASVLFIIGGPALGNAISKQTNISYIEVRPSLQATADIARNVYSENAFLGIGANKFVDAWRLYKDQSINSTVFWNTDFNAGNGYITTFFITTGILGGLAWVAFLGLFFVSGVRLLLVGPEVDRMWYFIGISSFVSALYVWGMSIIYVPGAVMLLIGALCTGITLTAYRAIGPRTTRVFTMSTDRRTGFIVTLVVIGIIVGSVSVLYAEGRHYAAAYTFNKSTLLALQNAPMKDIETQVLTAYDLSPSDVYNRRLAEYQYRRMNELLNTASPTQADQDAYNNAIATGVEAATAATKEDGTESANWATLGAFYSQLVAMKVDGVYDPAQKALIKARDLNPRNPIPYLELAALEGRAGKFDEARKYTEEAIALKPNYTDAFLYLSQLDIATGNVDGAIKSTLSIIRLEPENPARYYQLGVLYSSKRELDGAIASFEKAVQLDQNYANARYLLALAYDAKGRSNDAKTQLEKVLELNPGNVEVTSLLNLLDTQGSLQITASSTEQSRVVDEAVVVKDENGTVTTNEAPDSSLVVPVNTAPVSEENPSATPEAGAQ